VAPGEVERFDVGADLLDVGVDRSLSGGLDLKRIHQCRLRTLDLRREHGLFAHERVDEPLDQWDQVACQLEPSYALARPSQQRPGLAAEVERRVLGWQRMGNEGVDRLPSDGAALYGAGHASHGASKGSDRFLDPETTNVRFFLVNAAKRLLI
jgi:hypothetical protein